MAARSSSVDWLLASEEPAIRLLARRDLLGEDADDPEAVMAGAMVRALLAGQRADGGFGCHPYRKWSGAHWRLVSLVALGIPAGEPRALAAAETVLDWLTSPRRRVRKIDGLVRRCASIEGNALAACSRLGLADDARVRGLAERLVVLQALLVLPRLGVADDARTADARFVVRVKQRPDGRWRADGAWWRRPGSDRLADVVDWNRHGACEMLTR